jgi:ABC-2 type transport system permease protein
MSTRFAGTLRSEWIKFCSLRSTWFTLGGLVAVGLGLTLLSMDPAAQSYVTGTAQERQDWDPTYRSLMMYFIAQLIIGVLGVLVVTSEYATGLMRTSLSGADVRGLPHRADRIRRGRRAARDPR